MASTALVDEFYPPIPASVSLGSCQEFTILAGTSINFGSDITIVSTGSVGVSPGKSISGVYQLSTGLAEIDSMLAIACTFDLRIAHNVASTASCQYRLLSSELSGLTLTPGVYCSSSGMFTIARLASVTLDALNNHKALWVFQTMKVITGAGTSVNIVNGGDANNVYWVVGTSIKCGFNSSFVGNILAQTSITLGFQTKLNGRAFALNTVTLSGSITVTLPPTSTNRYPTILPFSEPLSPRSTRPSILVQSQHLRITSMQPNLESSSEALYHTSINEEELGNSQHRRLQGEKIETPEFIITDIESFFTPYTTQIVIIFILKLIVIFLRVIFLFILIS
jgi:hypothetical protein